MLGSPTVIREHSHYHHIHDTVDLYAYVVGAIAERGYKPYESTPCGYWFKWQGGLYVVNVPHKNAAPVYAKL